MCMKIKKIVNEQQNFSHVSFCESSENFFASSPFCVFVLRNVLRKLDLSEKKEEEEEVFRLCSYMYERISNDETFPFPSRSFSL